MDLLNITALQAAALVKEKQISARELTEAYLTRCSGLNSRLHSFINIFEESSLMQARHIDEKAGRGEELPPLAGVPVAVKDDLCCKDGPTTCGSPSLKNFVPPYHAAAVQRIVEAGAVILGKTNLPQLGLGSGSSAFFAGSAANPWNLDWSAGDGGAAALAANQCLLAVSSDTGGSLRLGASYCGLYGLRPTRGLVSRFGLNMYSPSFAGVGLLARNGSDAASALEHLAGYDPRDAATAVIKDGIGGPAGGKLLHKLKIGFPQDVFKLLEHDPASILGKALDNFRGQGLETVNIVLELFREALQCYYVIASAEASSNLGRFDGIRFGAPSREEDLEDWYSKTRSSTLGDEGKRRSVLGAYLLSGTNYERYYCQALKVRTLVRNEFLAALEKCDLIALPAAGGPAGPLFETQEFVAACQEDRFCAPVSLTGLPALVIPAGEVESLPLGLQLVAPPFGEGVLTSFASQFVTRITLPPAGDLLG